MAYSKDIENKNHPVEKTLSWKTAVAVCLILSGLINVAAVGFPPETTSIMLYVSGVAAFLLIEIRKLSVHGVKTKENEA